MIWCRVFLHPLANPCLYSNNCLPSLSQAVFCPPPPAPRGGVGICLPVWRYLPLKDQRPRIFVLWGAEKQIAEEPTEKLNFWACEANFDVEKVRQWMDMLPVLVNKRSEPAKNVQRACVWWQAQVYAKKQDVIKKTHLCRRTNNAIELDESQESDA